MYALLRGITSKHDGYFYCLNCFHSCSTKDKLKKHKDVCENHDYCCVEMPKEDNKILKYNHGEKSMKLRYIIYADLESLLTKMYTCYDHPNESPTNKINVYTPFGCSLFTHCLFDDTRDNLQYYMGQDCMKSFCKNLKEYAAKIINYEKRKMISLTDEENKSHNKQKVCYTCKNKFYNAEDCSETVFKKYQKVKDNCHYTGKYRSGAHNIFNLRYNTSKRNFIMVLHMIDIS